MKKIKLLHLQIDDNINISFKDGRNYIYGRNGSGKTIIFKCIMSVMGLSALPQNICINEIQLILMINDSEFTFNTKQDKYITISNNQETFKFRSQSSELNKFYSRTLAPTFIYESDFEDMITLLNFSFLTDSFSTNRKKQWESLNVILGVNVELLSHIQKDINILKKEVVSNKSIQEIINKFVKTLSEEIHDSNIQDIINRNKDSFFQEYKNNESILMDASLKLEQLEDESEGHLKNIILTLSNEFESMLNKVNINKYVPNLEEFIKDRQRSLSYGEEILSRFIFILSIAKLTNVENYNFPNLLINDGYLSGGLDNLKLDNSQKLLQEILDYNHELQYIEFTTKEPSSSNDIICNLNKNGWSL